jgi:hypothetical protein
VFLRRAHWRSPGSHTSRRIAGTDHASVGAPHYLAEPAAAEHRTWFGVRIVQARWRLERSQAAPPQGDGAPHLGKRGEGDMKLELNSAGGGGKVH